MLHTNDGIRKKNPVWRFPGVVGRPSTKPTPHTNEGVRKKNPVWRFLKIASQELFPSFQQIRPRQQG
jgi:hypothetical protein